MTSPTVSVFLPTYARLYDGYLERAIRSVQGQTYENWELIVVDDGSSDGSEDLIKGLMGLDSRIRHFRIEMNTGLPAYNTGIAFPESRGDYLSWIFDDCEWEANHLEVMLSEFQKSGAKWGYGRAKCHRQDGSVFLVGDPFDRERLLRGENHIPNSVVMIQRALIEELGWYDPHIVLKRCCDWDLWCRLSQKYVPFRVEHVLAEEHGTKLKDSLGHSYTVFHELISRYAQADRKERLRSASFGDFDCFDRTFVAVAANQEQEMFFFLLLEHSVRTNDVARLAALGREIQKNLDDAGRRRLVTLAQKSEGHSDFAAHALLALTNFYMRQAEMTPDYKALYEGLLGLHDKVTAHVYELRQVIAGYEKLVSQMNAAAQVPLFARILRRLGFTH